MSSSSPCLPKSDAHKFSHLYNYSGANKAGMEGIDKEKQAQIIYEMSKDSAYFKRAAKLDADTDVKVQTMRKTLIKFKGRLEDKLRHDVLQRSLELERKRSFDRICCVLDMDMFFAAVEIRDQPHLKDLPVAVGGMSMISTANYVARKYGVRAAMPGFIARKLCPQLVFVNSNFEKYQFVSGQIIDIIKEYDPNYSSHSLDEVYFDLTNSAIMAWQRSKDRDDSQAEGPKQIMYKAADADVPSEGKDPSYTIIELRAIAVSLLQEIRGKITKVTAGLTCSAGMANNFFLAKICADVNKPDGQYELPPTRQAVMDFVSELPTRKVGGIGKVTERMLDNLLDIKKMGQVRELLPQLLHTCTPVLFQFLLRTSLGIGSEEGEEVQQRQTTSDSKSAAAVTKPNMRKSLGCERTFSSKGISEPAELYEKLHGICTHVAKDMEEEDLWAKSVTLKLKNTEFELITRIATSPGYFNTVESIEALARGLLDELLPLNVRLMGVQVSKFRGAESAAGTDPAQRNILQFLREKSTVCSTNEDSSEEPSTAPTVQASSSSSATAGRKGPLPTPAGKAAAAESSLQHMRGIAGWLQQQHLQQEQEQEQHRCSRRDVASKDDRIIDLSEDGGASESHKEEEEEFSPGVLLRAGDSAFAKAISSPFVHSEKFASSSSANTVGISSMAPTYECPVCTAFVPGSLKELNAHLDRCLGQDHSSSSESHLSVASAQLLTSGETRKSKRSICSYSGRASALPIKKAKNTAGNKSFLAKGKQALELEITDYFCSTSQ